MTAMATHTKPALHNAMWPGLVGKGPDSEPPIDLDTMLRLTAETNVNGVKFDGVDLFLFDPHTSIDAGDDELKRLAEKVRGYKLAIGSLVAPVWPPTGGGSAMGNDEDRARFLTQVKKACAIGRKQRRRRGAFCSITTFSAGRTLPERTCRSQRAACWARSTSASRGRSGPGSSTSSTADAQRRVGDVR